MKGTISIPVGRYELVDGLIFTIRSSDAGAVVSISDPHTDRRQTAVIDEHGHVIAKSGQAEGVSPAMVIAAILRTGPVAGHRWPMSKLPKDEPKVKPPPDRVKFVLRYTSQFRPRDHARVLGGFTDGKKLMQVLYQIVLGKTEHEPTQLRLNGRKIILAARIPEGQRLPQTRFTEVCLLPEQATFKLGRRTFRKMTLAELRPLLKGRTIQVGPPKSG